MISKNFQLSNDFDVNSLNIFDKILTASFCEDLSHKIASEMELSAIKVNEDGINMLTLNGEHLLNQIPEIQLIYDEIFSQLKCQIKGLMCLEDLKIGISSNLLRSTNQHNFRLHFDRHEYTVILYLTDNQDFPLKLFPNIRTDPCFTNLNWLYDVNKKKPEIILPFPGKMVIFKGRTTWHGVEFHGDKRTTQDRISLQFGFDSTFKTFGNVPYYGHKNS